MTQETELLTNNYVYDVANRLTSVDGQAYTYDSNGNLLSDGASTYTYDKANRLSAVSQGGVSYSYAYNGLGDRLQQTVDTVTTNYTLDINRGLTQVLTDGTSTYLYGLGRIGEYNTAWNYYLTDALGSVRQLTDSTGAVALAQSYAPYGDVTETAGETSSNYGFAGEWTDGTGLQHLRARYLNTGIGRFISRDTWAGIYNRPMSLNRWMYVEGNPVNRADPSGMYWWGFGQTLFDSSERRANSQNVHIRIQALMMSDRDDQIHAEFPGANLAIPVPFVDLLNSISGAVWEIKPWDNQAQGLVDLGIRVTALNNASVNESLTGFDPTGTPFNWNYSPRFWFPGLEFPPELYIGTDDSGWYDIYAGRTYPGIIAWWKYKRQNKRLVPVPIVLPNYMAHNKRNERPDWQPGGITAPSNVPSYPGGIVIPPPSPEVVVVTTEVGLVLLCFIVKEAIEAALCGPCALLPP